MLPRGEVHANKDAKKGGYGRHGEEAVVSIAGEVIESILLYSYFSRRAGRVGFPVPGGRNAVRLNLSG